MAKIISFLITCFFAFIGLICISNGWAWAAFFDGMCTSAWAKIFIEEVKNG